MIFWIGRRDDGVSLSRWRWRCGNRRGGMSGRAAVAARPYVAALLALYAWLLPLIGFPILTITLLLILFKTIEPQRWSVAIIGALAATGVTWLVFGRWLGTQLPPGTLWAG